MISEGDNSNTNKKDGKSQSAKSYSMIEKPSSEQFGAESVSSIKKSAKQGKTRLEAITDLNMKQAELLESGEIKLASGKIIGHR